MVCPRLVAATDPSARRSAPPHPPPGDVLLVVGVDEERQESAIGSSCGLDPVRDVSLASRAVDELELRPGVFRVLRQIEGAAVCNPFELGPAEREEVLDVAGRARVVRELVGFVRAYAQVTLTDAVAGVPVEPLLDPVLVPLVRLIRRHEV